MKYLIILVLAGSSFVSCTNTSSESNKGTQHDTVRTTAMSSVGIKDTIIQNGEYIKHYKNGVIEKRGMMKDGKREGLWKSWYESGSRWSETTFSEGKKNGPTTTWYENEKKRYEGFYTNDNESGKWTFWDEKGNVANTKDYNQK